jgi:hypothetical protein
MYEFLFESCILSVWTFVLFITLFHFYLRFYDSNLQSEFILYIPCRVKKAFLTTLDGPISPHQHGSSRNFNKKKEESNIHKPYLFLLIDLSLNFNFMLCMLYYFLCINKIQIQEFLIRIEILISIELQPIDV